MANNTDLIPPPRSNTSEADPVTEIVTIPCATIDEMKLQIEALQKELTILAANQTQSAAAMAQLIRDNDVLRSQAQVHMAARDPRPSDSRGSTQYLGGASSNGQGTAPLVAPNTFVSTPSF